MDSLGVLSGLPLAMEDQHIAALKFNYDFLVTVQLQLTEAKIYTLS